MGLLELFLKGKKKAPIALLFHLVNHYIKELMK